MPRVTKQSNAHQRKNSPQPTLENKKSPNLGIPKHNNQGVTPPPLFTPRKLTSPFDWDKVIQSLYTENKPKRPFQKATSPPPSLSMNSTSLSISPKPQRVISLSTTSTTQICTSPQKPALRLAVDSPKQHMSSLTPSPSQHSLSISYSESPRLSVDTIDQRNVNNKKLRELTLESDLPQTLAYHVKIYQLLKQQREVNHYETDDIDDLLGPLIDVAHQEGADYIQVATPSVPPSIPPYDLDTSLLHSIKDFQKLRKILRHNGNSIENCDEILHLLRLTLARPKREIKELKEVVTEDTFRLGLFDIFEFYAKQPSLAETCPIFTQLEAGRLSIKIGKFLSFCRDFGVADVKSSQYTKLLPRSLVINIFYDNTEDHTNMLRDDFLLALDDIAQIYFDEEYDSIYGTSICNLPFKEKILMLYRTLECEDPSRYGKRMKGYRNPYYLGNNRRNNTEIRNMLSGTPANNQKKNSPQKNIKGQIAKNGRDRSNSRTIKQINPSVSHINKSPVLQKLSLSPRNEFYVNYSKQLKQDTLNRAYQLDKANRRQLQLYK